MRDTTRHAFTTADTLVCPNIPVKLEREMHHAKTLALCSAIVADVEHREICRRMDAEGKRR